MIPVVMVATGEVMPIGRTIPRIGRVGMVIGEPSTPPASTAWSPTDMSCDRRDRRDHGGSAAPREQEVRMIAHASTVKDRANAVAAAPSSPAA
ncbi:MAG: hypothetical protein R2692_06675 [Microbacterium sp.]